MRRLLLALCLLVAACAPKRPPSPMLGVGAPCDSSLTPTTGPRLGLQIPASNMCRWDVPLQFSLNRIDQNACFPGIACGVTLGTDTQGVLPLDQGGLGINGNGTNTGTLFVGAAPMAVGVKTPGPNNTAVVYDSAAPGGIRAGGAQKIDSLLGGLGPNTGFQHKRAPSCTPINGNAGTICSTVVTWDAPFADTAYTAVCFIEATSNTPVVLLYDGKQAGQITVTHGNWTVGTSVGNLNCVGIHD